MTGFKISSDTSATNLKIFLLVKERLIAMLKDASNF